MTNDSEEIDHEHRTDGFVCPYCGYLEEESYDWPETGNSRCNICEKEFRFYQRIEVYYTTYKL